jgi:hypothetical protein
VAGLRQVLFQKLKLSAEAALEGRVAELEEEGKAEQVTTRTSHYASL